MVSGDIDAPPRPAQAENERFGAEDAYARRLGDQARGAGGEAKRERTRARLKLAAIRLMDRVGHQELTITGVAQEAELAAGTFYTHFPDLKTLVCELLSEFLEDEVRPGTPLSDTHEPFEAMRAAFEQVIPLIRANRGLFRAVFALKDEDADVLALWQRATDKWVDALAEGARRSCGAPEVHERYYRFLAHASSAMADEVLFRVLIEEFEGLTGLARTDAELAELLAVLRYRLLFAANPDPARLTVAAPLARIVIEPSEPKRSR